MGAAGDVDAMAAASATMTDHVRFTGNQLDKFMLAMLFLIEIQAWKTIEDTNKATLGISDNSRMAIPTRRVERLDQTRVPKLRVASGSNASGRNGIGINIQLPPKPRAGIGANHGVGVFGGQPGTAGWNRKTRRRRIKLLPLCVPIFIGNIGSFRNLGPQIQMRT